MGEDTLKYIQRDVLVCSLTELHFHFSTEKKKRKNTKILNFLVYIRVKKQLKRMPLIGSVYCE